MHPPEYQGYLLTLKLLPRTDIDCKKHEET